MDILGKGLMEFLQERILTMDSQDKDLCKIIKLKKLKRKKTKIHFLQININKILTNNLIRKIIKKSFSIKIKQIKQNNIQSKIIDQTNKINIKEKKVEKDPTKNNLTIFVFIYKTYQTIPINII
jgi:hypothetical protein